MSPLALDFVKFATRGTYDVGVLMSTDTDLVPALEAALEIKTTGVHIEVAAWFGNGANQRLRIKGTNSLWCHQLRQADYEQIRDRRDYNQPPGSVDVEPDLAYPGARST